MTYDSTKLRLLTDRLVADGMNHWVYDTEDAATDVDDAGYISNAKKGLKTPGIGMIVGDQVTVRQWTDITDMSTGLLKVTTHIVTTIADAGATLGAGVQLYSST